MTIEKVILDFDGTVTKTDEEAVQFVDGYKADLISKTIPDKKEEFEQLWNNIQATVLQRPGFYGWKYNDKIIAPAYSDPYVLCTTIADLLLDELNLFSDQDKRTALLYNLYKKNYERAGIAFKQRAKEFLYTLSEKLPVVIVTNSNTDNVTEKLNTLDPSLLERIPVIGSAKKYVVDDNWDEIPETQSMEGLERPVFLRRKEYYDVLRRIVENASFESLLVIGDIYELDLALPNFLGANICLVANPNTPNFEKKFVKSQNKGHVSENLKDVLGIIR